MKKDYTLIIVDNDQDDHRFIIRGLKQANYNFNYARVYGGEELLALLLKKDLHKDSKVINPDFILLDINMPKFSGFQTLRILKANAELKKIPVYVLSTATDEHLIGTVISLGAEYYYSKPTDIDRYKMIFEEICAKLNQKQAR
jgi:DNA-binding response OmpR family regulator